MMAPRWTAEPAPSYQPGCASSTLQNTCGKKSSEGRYAAIAILTEFRTPASTKFVQLTVLLHHLQELDDDLRARPYQTLTFTSLLCVVDGLERIIEY